MRTSSHRATRGSTSTFLAAGLVASLLGVAGVLEGLTPAYATSPTSSSVILKSDGVTPASLVTTSDDIIQKTLGPSATIGLVDDTIEQVIDPTITKVRGISSGGSTVPDVTAPSGWTVQYNDGSGWSGTPPAYDAPSSTYPTLTGVRTFGSIQSEGTSGGGQVVSRTAAGNLESSVVFNGSSGGDGWDVFFGGNRIFNIWHHDNGAVQIDCHDRAGTACWSGTPSTFAMTGYTSSPTSTGFYDATRDRIYAFSIRHSDDSMGLVCAKDVSTSHPSACDDSFIPFAAAGAHNYERLADSVQLGDKIFMRGAASNDRLLCFDITSATKCGTDGTVTDVLSGNGYWYDNRLLAVGSKIFISTGTQLACYDDATGGMCAGFGMNGVRSATTARALFFTTDSSGTPTQVCAYRNATCWNIATGTNGSWPTNLGVVAGSIYDGWGKPTNIETQLFFYEGDYSRCFDFATNNSCAGYTGQYMGWYPYATTLDPNNSRCLWSNSNGGNIKSFVRATGAVPCNPMDTVVIPYTAIVPLLGCSESDRVTSWTSLKVISPSGANVSSATVTVRDTSGAELNGWKNLPVTLTPEGNRYSGTLSLASLPVNNSMLRPTFAITFVGLNDATGGSGTFTLTQGAPALCVGAKPQAITLTCPTGLGPGSADFPYGGADITFTSTVTMTPDGGSPTSETTTGRATRVRTKPKEDCLTKVTGHIYRGATANAAGSVTVTLLSATDDTPLATTTTAPDGSYSFDWLYPNSYRARAGSTTGDGAVVSYVASPGSTALPNVVIPPTVDSVTPAIGPAAGGTVVTVTGTGFASGATVKFDDSLATSVIFNSDTSITATTPAHAAGPVSVTVTNINNLSGSKSSAYTYIAAPTVTSLTPVSGPTAGGTSVTITGTGFAADDTVSIGGVACGPLTGVTATSITCTTGAHISATVTVTVTDVYGQSGSKSNAYTYIPPPSITSMTPVSGPTAGGTRVTISGTDFLATPSVTFGGAAGTIVSISGTTIVVDTPVHALGLVEVKVTNPDGQWDAEANAFTYVPPPAVTSLSPVAGPTSGGTAITINGGQFRAGATVSFSGSACAPVTVIDDTTLACTTGTHAAGLVNVVITNPDGQIATLAGSYTYVPPPVISSLTPTSGPIAGGTVVTITGTGFTNGAAVTFDDSPATVVSVLSSTSITATSPAHAAGPVTVKITNPDAQTGTKVGGFTYVADAPAPDPAPSPSASPSPSPSPSATPSPTPTPTPSGSPSPAPTPTPVPVPSPLASGQSVLLVNGAPAPVDVEPNTTSNGLQVQGDGWRMDLHGLDGNGTPLNLGPGGVLVLEADRQARTTGDGFLANSEVGLYLDPPVMPSGAATRAANTSALLGMIDVNASGSFDGIKPLPPGIEPGTHILQAVGYGPSGEARALSLTILVKAWIRLIPGTRTEASDGRHDRLRASGITGGIPAGARLIVRIKVHKDNNDKDGKAVIHTNRRGKFAWSRLIQPHKPIVAFITYKGIRSNKGRWKPIRHWTPPHHQRMLDVPLL